jgi:hypothetical protein
MSTIQKDHLRTSGRIRHRPPRFPCRQILQDPWKIHPALLPHPVQEAQTDIAGSPGGAALPAQPLIAIESAQTRPTDNADGI